MIYQRCENVGNVKYDTKLIVILAYLIKLYIALFSVSAHRHTIQSLINPGRGKGMVGMYMVGMWLSQDMYLLDLFTHTRALDRLKLRQCSFNVHKTWPVAIRLVTFLVKV